MTSSVMVAARPKLVLLRRKRWTNNCFAIKFLLVKNQVWIQPLWHVASLMIGSIWTYGTVSEFWYLDDTLRQVLRPR